MIQVVVERENVNDEFVVIRKIYRRDGENVVKDELILDIETSKTVTEIHAPEAGILFVAVSEGDEVEVGSILFKIGESKAVIKDTQHITNDLPEKGGANHAEIVFDSKKERKLSQAAELIAKQLGVNLDLIESRGWITASDVRAAAAHTGASNASNRQPELTDPAEKATLTIASSKPTQQAIHRVPYREKRSRSTL